MMKPVLYATTAVVASVLTVGMVQTKASADTVPYFMIVNKYSSMPIDLIGGSTVNGGVTNQWTYDYNSTNQRWSIVPDETGAHYKIIGWDTGKALSVSNDSTGNGAQIWQWDYNSDPSQQWDLIDAGNGWFYIQNVRSGLVLDDDGYGTTNNTEVDQWSNNSTNGSGADVDNQLWRLQPWGDYYVKAAGGRYVCIQNQGSADGSPIIQYDQENNPWFKWQFNSEGDGWYGLFSLNAPGRVLCVDNASTALAADCHLWDYNPSNIGDQKIRVEPRLDGTYKFYWAHDGMSWDIPGGNTADNVPLQQYTDNGNSWQEFNLERTDNVGGPENTVESVAASSVPSPSSGDVMSFEILNGTNGEYANNQIYWGIIGQNPANNNAWSYVDINGNLQPISAALNNASGHLVQNGVNYANIYHTIDQAQWVSLPKITAARMYISIGSPCYMTTYDSGFAGPNIDNPSDPNSKVDFDFIEFTIDGAGYHGNTTRVDMFGFPLQHRLVNFAGDFDQTVGELEFETKNGIFSKYQNELSPNPQFLSLGTSQAPYRIVAPIHGSFAAGQPNANYFSGYSSIDTQDILLGTGAASDPGTCSAINRHVYTTSSWTNVANYYNAAPANFYAQFWHNHGINGLAYGFCYDDYNGQAAYLSIGDPKGLILRVGQ